MGSGNTAVLDVTDNIRQNVNNNLCTFLFLFDLTRVFDVIDYNLL